MPQENTSCVPLGSDTPTPTPVEIRSLVEATRRMPQKASIAELLARAPEFFQNDIVAPERLVEAGQKLYGSSPTRSIAEATGALMAGIGYQRIGNFEEAEGFYDIAAYHPQSRKALIAQTQKLLTESANETTLLLLGQTIAKGAPEYGRDSSWGHYACAIVHLRLGNLPDAKRSFNQAALDRTGEVAGHMLSFAEILEGTHAIHPLEFTVASEAVFNATRNPKAAVLAGIGYERLGDHTESERMLANALGAHPKAWRVVKDIRPDMVFGERYLGTLDNAQARSYRYEQQLRQLKLREKALEAERQRAAFV